MADGSNVDGQGFHVEVDRLQEAATGIRASIDAQHNAPLRGLCGVAPVYGHDRIQNALRGFCARWSDGLDMLVDDAGAVGAGLARAAAAYRWADTAAARSFETAPAQQAVRDG